MRKLKSFEDALAYVNRLGLVHPQKPIGWRQSNLVEIVERLETASVNAKMTNYPYPMEVHFNRALSHRRLDFTVNGEVIRFDYPR